MKQLQNFRLSAAGVEAQGEVRGIILQCTSAQIFQYVAISSAKSLTWLWMLQLWVFATDDLYMKKDKHFWVTTLVQVNPNQNSLN